MKKSYLFLIVSFILYSFTLKAQITVEAFPMNPQSGQYNYFGVRVTLAETYTDNVTVTGYIYDEGNGPNTNHPFTLTVPAGELTAETAANFYQTDPTATAVAELGTLVVIYAGVPITYEANGCILKFNSLGDLQAVLNQLDADNDAYNDDFDNQYGHLSEEELDEMDEQNEFDEFKTYKDFEALFGGFCSKRAEIEAVENAWLANNFTGTDPDDIDLTFDEAENTIFNNTYSFKIGNDLYQLTSAGLYKNGVYQDDGGGGARISTENNNLMFANLFDNTGYRYSGPFISGYVSNIWTDCKTNKRKKSPPIEVSSTRRFIQKVAISSIGVRTSIKGKIVHYKKKNGNWKRKKAEMAVGVNGPVYNLSCSSLGNKSKTNPNGAGYKKRKSLKVKEWDFGTIWKTYSGEVGTSFAAAGGYGNIFLLTW